MLRALSGIVAISLSLAMPAVAVGAPKKPPVAQQQVKKHAKHHVKRKAKGYGFLPGYRPPSVIAHQREVRYRRLAPHYYGPAWPRFHQGRWNGGGFGPCYTSTPIGYMWTCGR